MLVGAERVVPLGSCCLLGSDGGDVFQAQSKGDVLELGVRSLGNIIVKLGLVGVLFEQGIGDLCAGRG